MMTFHTKNLTSPEQKVGQSLGLMEFITDSAAYEKVHHAVLEDEFKNLTERNFENIFHDDLSDFNHPVYFHEFAAHAEKHNLQFVTEVEYFNAKINSKEVLEVLEKISGGNIIVFEQYLDFIKGRRFRQSLLCRKDVKISTRPDPDVLRRIRIASPVRPVSEKPELATGKHEHFAGEKTEKVEIDHPLTKAALFHLGQIWARSISFDELVKASVEILTEESGANFEITKKDEDILAEVLFHIFCSGLLRLHVHEPFYTTTVSEKPLASPIARWQAEHSDLITTLLCTAIAIQDELGVELIKLLDGTRDKPQLNADLTAFINSEKFDQPDDVKEKLLQDLPRHLDKNLDNFAKMALFLA